MRITFLGTGTSQGVPVIACNCEVCSSEDWHDKRLRTSVLVETQDRVVVIDTGPDFRYQMLREHVSHLDAVVFTHEHKDHLAGLDDIRAFNFKDNRDMDVYATAEVQQAIVREFSYIFSSVRYPGIPRINLIEIDNHPFYIGSTQWIPIEVMHFKLPVMAFRVGDFSYITDAKTISDLEKAKLKGTRKLVLNALQRESHISHLTLEEALQLASEIGADETYLTHISHRMGRHEEIQKTLPPGVFLAYDGLKLEM